MRLLRRLGVSLLATVPTALPAQVVPDAWTVPRGALRVSLSPHYLNWDRVFTADGGEAILGRFLETDSLGGSVLPTVRDAQGAVRALTGDSTYRMTAGAFRANLDADLRHIPLRFQLGLTDRITLSVGVPIVLTTMNAAPRLDSTGANAGINPGPAGAAALLNELESAITALSGRIAAGDFGCPAGTQCDQARDVLLRAMTTRDLVAVLFGAGTAGVVEPAFAGVAPAFAPLAGSDAAAAIAAELQDLSSALTALGTPGLTATALPFPESAADTAGLTTVLTDPTYGYAGQPLETTKLTRRLGDVEVGLRVGVLRAASARAVLSSTVRLPTGQRADPDDFLQIPAGDRQLDIEIGGELALEPGNTVALWLGGSYNLQLSDRLTRRVAPPDTPLPLAATSRLVDRNLGDELRLSAYPSIRLTERFRVFTTVAYYRKGADRFPGNEVLEELTAMERLSYGGGLWYRAPADAETGKLPLEAGLVYRAAFSGNGGLTPKTSGVEFSLRLYYRLWGAPPAPAASAASAARQERQERR